MSVDIKQLFEAGACFGHQASRWNPKMGKYIYTKRDGVHIIDLEQTVAQIAKAEEFLTGVASRGRQILFVGTKKQMRETVKAAAEACGMPYVTERWMGGMLTNQSTIVSQIKKLKMLERRMNSGELANRYNKLEAQHFQEQIDTLNVRYGGVKEMRGKPGAVVVLGAVSDHNAIVEAHKLHIPVVALCDTNADPNMVDYVIPANDDAITVVKMIADDLSAAVAKGAATASKRAEERKAALTAQKGDK